jgi:uncharacterized protein (DUF2164 family)
MRVALSGERRERMLLAVRGFFAEQLDQELSEFQAGLVIDFFVGELGPPVYNQAIADVRAWLEQKVGDLEGEFYEPDERGSR